jgi:hypothetical protein
VDSQSFSQRSAHQEAANAMKSPTRLPPFLLILGLAAGLSTMDLRGQAASARAATGATESNITRLTTNLLEQSQFAHHPLDSELAAKFLNRYLDDLDGEPGHSSCSPTSRNSLRTARRWRRPPAAWATPAQPTASLRGTCSRLQQRVAYTLPTCCGRQSSISPDTTSTPSIANTPNGHAI